MPLTAAEKKARYRAKYQERYEAQKARQRDATARKRAALGEGEFRLPNGGGSSSLRGGKSGGMRGKKLLRQAEVFARILAGEVLPESDYSSLRAWAAADIKAGLHDGDLKSWCRSQGFEVPEYSRDYRIPERGKEPEVFWQKTAKPILRDPETRWIGVMLLHLGKRIDIKKVRF